MDDINQNPTSNTPVTKPVIEEVPATVSTPPGTDNAFGTTSTNPPFNAPPLITRPGETNGGPGSPLKKVAVGLVGLLLLIGAVGAGILLVQQQQDVRNRASSADNFCGAVNQPINSAVCDPNNVCWKASTVNQCLVNGQPQGATEFFTGMGNFDGQVCYTCINEPGSTVDNPGSVVCSPGTKVGGNNSLCPGGTTPQPTPTPGLCDNSCQTNADCAPTSETNAELTCNTTIHMCVNRLCPNDTIPGNRCDCRTPVQTCGQPCGAGYPLCAAGASCRFISGQSCTSGTVANPKTYCLPESLPSGWTQAKCVGPEAGNSYVLFNGKNPTPAQVQTACAPATATPTGQCLNVRMYDTGWNLLTDTQKSALKGGDVIRVTVEGSSTSGSFDQARFTFNGTLRSPVTQKKPGTNEFYDEITIPAGATSINVKGELHHSDLGWF